MLPVVVYVGGVGETSGSWVVVSQGNEHMHAFFSRGRGSSGERRLARGARTATQPPRQQHHRPFLTTTMPRGTFLGG